MHLVNRFAGDESKRTPEGQIGCFDAAIVLDDARGMESLDEGRGASIHDRRLRRVGLDLEVVDAQTRDGGENVLDGMDRDRIFAELGLALGKDDAFSEGRNGWSIRQIRPPKE